MSRPDLYPDDLEAWERTVRDSLPPMSMHPTPAELERHHERQQSLLQRVRHAYGQTDGVDEPECHNGQSIRGVLLGVLLLLLVAAGAGVVAVAVWLLFLHYSWAAS